MRIHLVQHGDAVPKEIDPERPLSARGRHDVERLAAFLAKHVGHVSRVLHSGKLRAQQTAELVQWTVDPQHQPQQREGLAPNDPVGPVAAELEGAAADAMLVGHQPFLGRLAARLVTGDEQTELLRFVPGSAACLERDPEGRWAVVWMVRPEVLEP